MNKYEYKIVELKHNEKLTKSSASDFNEILNQQGQQGWRLVQIHYPLANHVRFDYMNIIFERELDE